MCCQAAAAMTVCAPLLQQYKRMTTTSWSSQIINYTTKILSGLYGKFLVHWVSGLNCPGGVGWYHVSCFIGNQNWFGKNFNKYGSLCSTTTQILFKNVFIFISFHYYYTKKTSGLVSLAYIYKMTLHFQSCLCNGLACNSEWKIALILSKQCHNCVY